MRFYLLIFFTISCDCLAIESHKAEYRLSLFDSSLETGIKDIKGKFSLSYYDFELLQEWLPKNEFVWEEKQFTKQAGTKKDGTRDKGTELLIMNYDINKKNKLIGEFF